MTHSFVPEDFVLTDKLKDFAREKGYTEKHLKDQEEKWRDAQYKTVIKCWDRAWRRWVRNSIEWGHVVPATNPEYRGIQELTEEQKTADVLAFERDKKRYGK